MLKPTLDAMCAGIIGEPAPYSAFQSPNGLAKTTVAVLPLSELVTDLIELQPAVAAGRKALPPTSLYLGSPLCACQL